MKYLEVRNVQEALRKGRDYLKWEGTLEGSRYGDVRVAPNPVVTHYMEPTERVLFYPERDANPFFHFMEGLWMIAGRNDVEWISRYSGKIAEFSDDGETFHGAYGHRWRRHFTEQIVEQGVAMHHQATVHYHPVDQVAAIIQLLRKDPKDRRTVLQMWDPEVDLGFPGKDFPCNTNIYFRVVHGELDMTVCNRSNDMILGAYGANAVHMSMLQEYVAAGIGVPVGHYYQISNNFHAYASTWEKCLVKEIQDPYVTREVQPFPMVKDFITWDQELYMFMEEGAGAMGYREPFFRKVASPMQMAWDAWKEKDIQLALKYCQAISATDWQKACTEWLRRRMK